MKAFDTAKECEAEQERDKTQTMARIEKAKNKGRAESEPDYLWNRAILLEMCVPSEAIYPPATCP